MGCNKVFILHCHNSFDSVNKAFYHKCALYQTSKGVTVHWGTLSDLLGYQYVRIRIIMSLIISQLQITEVLARTQICS